MKKLLTLIISGCVMMSVLAGCGGASETVQQESSGSGGKSSGEKIQLSVWQYYDELEEAQFKKSIEAFNNSQDRIVVSTEFVPREELMKQYTMGLVADNLPDIGMVDNPDHASFSAMGLFEDITAKAKEWGELDQFFEGPLKSCMYEGKLYGLPHNSNCITLWYDTDMFAEAGITEPPATWDELKEVAKKLTTPDRYGFGIASVKHEEGTFQMLPWILSTGAVVEKLDSPEAIRGVTYLADLINEGIMSKETINWTQGDLMQQFQTGKVAMMINGPWNIAMVKKENPTKNFKVALIPKDKQYSSVLGGENFGIMAGKNVDAAWEFLKYIGSKDVVKDYCVNTGKLPPRSDSMEATDYWTKDPLLSVFKEQMQYAQPRGPHPKWPEISSAMITAVHEAFTGVKTPEQAMQDAQATVTKALNK